jgi:hypothetical protein
MVIDYSVIDRLLVFYRGIRGLKITYSAVITNVHHMHLS